MQRLLIYAAAMLLMVSSVIAGRLKRVKEFVTAQNAKIIEMEFDLNMMTVQLYMRLTIVSGVKKVICISTLTTGKTGLSATSKTSRTTGT